ncbi:MAG: glycosyltransferase family 2 protein, partial [Burkholderiales bacterium]|nr:glycosyltransferase family 2 protein [Burkholderiales bacterium]
MQLSVVVITKNEAGHIADCLKSVPFADEWVVLDSASSDATRAIAQGLGARVEASADWPGFGAQKNRALALARGQWVLSIDADERVSAELAREIVDALQRERVAPTGVAGFELSRLSRFCGQWMHHGDWYPDRVLRLFRRGSARFSDDL